MLELLGVTEEVDAHAPNEVADVLLAVFVRVCDVIAEVCA